jgi:deoxyxylulose-5-phosphate synthase
MLAKALVVHSPLDRKVVVTVGGAALGGPMGRLALLRIGAAAHGVVIVVFDDLGRSDGPADGELPAHLADLRQRDREDRCGEPFAFVPDNLFEPLGLAYLGPIDGHDVDAMEYALRLAGWLGKPVLVHCVTRQPAARAKDVASKPTGSFLPTVPPVRSRLSPQLRQQRAVQRHRLLQPTASQATHPAPRRIGRRVP